MATFKRGDFDINQVKRAAAEAAAERIATIRCPKHDEAPKNVRVVESLDDERVPFGVGFDPCCEELNEEVKRAVALNAPDDDI